MSSDTAAAQLAAILQQHNEQRYCRGTMSSDTAAAQWAAIRQHEHGAAVLRGRGTHRFSKQIYWSCWGSVYSFGFSHIHYRFGTRGYNSFEYTLESCLTIVFDIANFYTVDAARLSLRILTRIHNNRWKIRGYVRIIQLNISMVSKLRRKLMGYIFVNRWVMI